MDVVQESFVQAAQLLVEMLERNRGIEDGAREGLAIREGNATHRACAGERALHQSTQHTWDAGGPLVTATLDKQFDGYEGEVRLWLRLESRAVQGIAGDWVVNEIEIPIHWEAIELGAVLEGFVQSLSRVRSNFCDVDRIIDDAGPWLVQSDVEQNNEKKLELRQMQCVKQTHPNACGFHALFNALLLTGHGHASSTGFWCETLRWLRLLERHNRQEERWRSSSIRSVTADQAHLDFIVAHDERLQGKVFMVHSYDFTHSGEAKYKSALSSAFHSKCAVTFVVGAETHWLMVGLVNDGKRCVFADSFNKPVLQFVQVESEYRITTTKVDNLLAPGDLFMEISGMAEHFVSVYAPRFVAKLRRSSVRYSHMPNDTLLALYDSGVPEYWKGKVKNELWWQHRPRSVRVMLMNREVTATKTFLDTVIRDILVGLQHPKSDESFPGRMTISSSLRNYFEQADNVIRMRADAPRTQSIDESVAPAIVNLTARDSRLISFVRKEEPWPEDSPEFKAGRNVENRYKPPPAEYAGDVFDRQRVIPEFAQGVLERQVCLVIGTGGIGQNTALALSRLGVHQVLLCDYDVVEPSNLTRQCLVGLCDTGTRKVDAARLGLERGGHSLRTGVRTLDGDVLELWPTVVQLARGATAVFNCADVGPMFDYCVMSLCKELRLPCISGQSFAWKFMSECYLGSEDSCCAFCEVGTKSSFGLGDVIHIANRVERTFPQAWSEILSLQSKPMDDAIVERAMRSFMESDEQFRVRGATAQALISKAVKEASQALMADAENGKPSRTRWLECFLSEYMKLSLSRLAPGSVSLLEDLCFVPRPVLPQTRFFGSWVAPCLTCASLMVGHWANLLCSPKMGRNPPCNIIFNLDECMTSEEQMAYELGIPLDAADRTFARSTSPNPKCTICHPTNLLATKQNIMFGSSRVSLRPAKGQSKCAPLFLPREKQPTDDNRVDHGSKSQNGDLVFPMVPACTPIFFAQDDLLGPELPPALMQQPLIKCSLEQGLAIPNAITQSVISSGVRSAIVLSETGGLGHAYRIKGCGNGTEASGFEVRSQGDNGEPMVRGCCFENTAAQELYMTKVIEDALRAAPVNMRCANRPLAVYKYSPEEIRGSQSAIIKDVGCYACIYETRGERRLGDHLLRGLEELLPALFDQVLKDASLCEQLKVQLQVAREQNKDDELWDTATLAECGFQVADLRTSSLLKETTSGLASFRPREQAQGGCLAEIWDQAVASLQHILDNRGSNKGSLVLELAFRLGYECGEFARVLADAQISWGTYPDATGVHCNAHANNMVVLSPFPVNEKEHDSSCLLAPVDFDMAFCKESFLPHVVREQHNATAFPTTWEELIMFEQRLGMRTSLAGSSFTSTGVANSSDSSLPRNSLLPCLFRDALVAGLDASLAQAHLGANADKIADKVYDEDYQGHKSLIILALIQTFHVES